MPSNKRDWTPRSLVSDRDAVTGIAWYRRDQWARFRKLASAHVAGVLPRHEWNLRSPAEKPPRRLLHIRHRALRSRAGLVFDFDNKLRQNVLRSRSRAHPRGVVNGDEQHV